MPSSRQESGQDPDIGECTHLASASCIARRTESPSAAFGSVRKKFEVSFGQQNLQSMSALPVRSAALEAGTGTGASLSRTSGSARPESACPRIDEKRKQDGTPPAVRWNELDAALRIVRDPSGTPSHVDDHRIASFVRIARKAQGGCCAFLHARPSDLSSLPKRREFHFRRKAGEQAGCQSAAHSHAFPGGSSSSCRVLHPQAASMRERLDHERG